MKRFSVRLLFFVFAALFVLFLCSPDTVQRTAHESVLFCAAVLIPSLFPGFVLSDILINLSFGKKKRSNGLFFRMFRLPASMIRCWLIGLLAGFPAAADCAGRMVLSGEVHKKDAERCLAFTNNPGIVFVVCAVGSGMFGSFSVGIYLWLIQTVSALLVGILLANPDRNHETVSDSTQTVISLKHIFPKAVVSSVTAVLNICGFVIFFRVLIAVLTSALPLDPLRTVLAGMLEMTCGISALPEFCFTTAIAASLMLGWSGFSVHFQIMNVISIANLSPRYYFPGKILQAIFSAGLTVATYPLIFHLPQFEMNWISLFCLAAAILITIAVRFRKEYLYGKRNLRT